MQLQNPFEIIIDRLNAIQTKVGDIDTIVRSGNLPPVRKEKKPAKSNLTDKIKNQEKEGRENGK